MESLKDKMRLGCLVKFPNGLILPIKEKTAKGLLFEVKGENVELRAENFHQCEFLGENKGMKFEQPTLF